MTRRVDRTKIIHFAGYSGSGKTFAISLLTKELTKRGKRVGTLKHIHNEGFSIDKEGKDTWIQRKAGASTVIAISNREFVVMKSRSEGEMDGQRDLKDAFQIFKRDKLDYVFVEGFHGNFSKMKEYGYKEVVCARNAPEAISLLKVHREPICILCASRSKTSFSARDDSLRGILVLGLPRDKDRLIQLIS